jgi:hypothetical protein
MYPSWIDGWLQRPLFTLSFFGRFLHPKRKTNKKTWPEVCGKTRNGLNGGPFLFVFCHRLESKLSESFHRFTRGD